MPRTIAGLQDQTLKPGGKRNLTVTDGLQNPWVMERAKAPRATVGALKKVAANGMAVEPAARYARRTFNGNCMARDLVASAVSCRRPSFLDGQYEWTDHQAFDPNRDNRHFERGSFRA